MATKFKIVATVYDRKGRILSTGQNNYLKTHPTQKMHADKAGMSEKIYLHAEIDALIRVKHGVPHSIRVERYGKSGQELNAEPCPVCRLAIVAAGIKEITFTIG